MKKIALSALLVVLAFLCFLHFQSKESDTMSKQTNSSDEKLKIEPGKVPAHTDIGTAAATDRTLQTEVIYDEKKPSTLLAVESESRLPDQYKEAFPGIDSYRWLYKGMTSVAKRRSAQKLAPELYRDENVRLIDIKQGDLINFRKTEVDQFLERLQTGDAGDYTFRGGELLSKYEAGTPNLQTPVCSLDLPKESRSRPATSFKVKNVAMTESETNEPTVIRIDFDETQVVKDATWLNSITCKFKNVDDAKQMRIVHLRAMLNIFVGLMQSR